MKLSERLRSAEGMPAAARLTISPRAASPEGEGETTAAPPAAVVDLEKSSPTPLPGFSEPLESRSRGQQPVDAFAALKQRAATALFERMGTRFNDSATKEEDLRTSAREELTRIIDAEQVPLSAEERSRLVRDVADDVLGYGPLQRLLDDPAVTEIMVNRMDQIYVERHGKLTLTESRFSSEDHLRKVIERIVSKVGRRIDESSPLVDARLEDGSRVNAVIPPLAVGGSSLTIRKFSKVPLTVRNLIEFGTLTPEMAELLNACVKAKLNIIVSGGTGTGKTTLLNVLSSFLPHDERIVTIEDAVELQIQQEHVVRLESRPSNTEGKGEVTIRELLRNSLRMRPDRIVVGEVRGGESLDMLQAMNTGHDGSLSTVHSNSPRDAVARLETLVLMAGMDLPLRAIREQIASAVNLIIQISRLRDGTRRITHVTEVQGMEGDIVTLQDAFVFDYAAGVDAHGRFLGKPVPTGIRPRFIDRFEDLGIHVSANVFAAPLTRPEGRELSMTLLPIGVGLLFSAVVVLGIVLLAPGGASVPLDRRRPVQGQPDSQLSRFAGSAVHLVDGFFSHRKVRLFNREALEQAGLRLSQADFYVLLLAGAVAGGLAGFVVAGPLLGLLLVLLAPVVGHLVIGFLTGKRRSKFDLQLGDTLQLLSGGLRAGHSILRAIDAAAAESQSPTSEEMRRVVTETSLGRDLLASLSDTADRMRNEDFVWIAQAIQINREVGGNLAEVLDQVNETIRERSEIKGHIKSLAAEGKFSAYILMAMPIGIVVMLMLVNPGYMNAMFTHPLGWGMIVASVILMTIGGLWMRKIIDLKF